MGWFTSRRRLEVELIDALLKGELERRRAQSDLDSKMAEIELKKREMELANLAAIHDEKRKDAADRQKLREQRQNWAKTARDKKRERDAGGNLFRRTEGCRVCHNQGDPTLTADEISFHHAGHPERAA